MNCMNGEKIWCRPAPVRTRSVYDIESVDTDRSLLAEMPRLIEMAIKRGLVYRPDVAPSSIGHRSVTAICKKCRLEFTRSKSSHYATCHICRIPPAKCKACEQTFQPKLKKQTTCSPSCQQELARRARLIISEAAGTLLPSKECPICGTIYKVRNNGRKTTMTCSRTCGIALMVKNREQSRKEK